MGIDLTVHLVCIRGIRVRILHVLGRASCFKFMRKRGKVTGKRLVNGATNLARGGPLAFQRAPLGERFGPQATTGMQWQA